jgi:hypothetical protein
VASLLQLEVALQRLRIAGVLRPFAPTINDCHVAPSFGGGEFLTRLDMLLTQSASP